MGSKVGIDADVDHDDFGRRTARKNVDGSSTGKEITHHLAGHILRIGAYTFCGNAVIGSKQIHGFGGTARTLFFSDTNHSAREFLETSQAPKGLGKTVQPSSRDGTP